MAALPFFPDRETPDHSAQAIGDRMTPDDVERIALTLPGTVRDPRWGRMGFHHQRRFALIRDDETLYLRVSPQDQALLLSQAPGVFSKFEGRGPAGLTVVALGRIDGATLRSALERAWRHAITPDHGRAWNP